MTCVSEVCVVCGVWCACVGVCVNSYQLMPEPTGHVLNRKHLLQQIHYLIGIHAETGRDRHPVVQRGSEEEASAVADELQSGGFAEVMVAIVVNLWRQLNKVHAHTQTHTSHSHKASRTVPVIVASAALTASYSFSEQLTSMEPAAAQEISLIDGVHTRFSDRGENVRCKGGRRLMCAQIGQSLPRKHV